MLLFFFIHKPPHYHRPHILRMVVPTDKPPDSHGFQMFSKYSFLRDIAKKTIHTVNFNEPYPPYDPSIFHLRQGFITREIERMQFTHDTYFDDNFYFVANPPDKPVASASTLAPDY